jgi:hypothetical protein
VNIYWNWVKYSEYLLKCSVWQEWWRERECACITNSFPHSCSHWYNFRWNVGFKYIFSKLGGTCQKKSTAQNQNIIVSQ